MEDFLNQIYFGNSILEYITAIGILVLVIVVVKIFRLIVLKRLKKWAAKTQTTIDDFILNGIKKSVSFSGPVISPLCLSTYRST